MTDHLLLAYPDPDPRADHRYDIVTCSTDGTVRCIDAATRLEVSRLTPNLGEHVPSALAISAASRLVALGSTDGFVRLLVRRADAVPSLILGWRGRMSTSEVVHVAFSSSGAHLAVTSSDGTTTILALTKGASAPSLLSSFVTAVTPTSIAWTSTDKLLVAMPDGQLLLHAASEIAPPPISAAPVRSLPSTTHVLEHDLNMSMRT